MKKETSYSKVITHYEIKKNTTACNMKSLYGVNKTKSKPEVTCGTCKRMIRDGHTK